ncbi:hypothetical protein ABZ499_11110 [Streptomyces sp. NPDC019990]|uniref:hypothetical protein n=1 Tax=Streptomyces sp. NPDC019990 TaxID=3154693 RepID=UPI0033DDAAA7
MKIGSTRRRVIVTVIAGALGIAAIGVTVDTAEEMSHRSTSSAVSQDADVRVIAADYEPQFATWEA